MRYFKLTIGLAIITSFVVGFSIHQWFYKKTEHFYGIWSGATLINYEKAKIKAHFQIIISKDNIKAIVDYRQPQGHASSQIRGDLEILEAKGHHLELSVSNLEYIDKDSLQNVIGRELPAQGYIMESSVWPINQDKIFLMATLGFGEQFGLFLTKE